MHKLVKKPKLVPGWHRAWRWLSMQAMALAAALQIGWASLDADLRASIPGELVTALTVVILLAGALGRLVDQDKSAPEQDAADGQDGGEVGQ